MAPAAPRALKICAVAIGKNPADVPMSDIDLQAHWRLREGGILRPAFDPAFVDDIDEAAKRCWAS